MELLNPFQPHEKQNASERDIAKWRGSQLAGHEVDASTGTWYMQNERSKRAAPVSNVTRLSPNGLRKTVSPPVASLTSGRSGDVLVALVRNQPSSNVRKLETPMLTKGNPKWCPRCGQ
jgi:hypothetical protein